jgi:hypothetical protein
MLPAQRASTAMRTISQDLLFACEARHISIVEQILSRLRDETGAVVPVRETPGFHRSIGSRCTEGDLIARLRLIRGANLLSVPVSGFAPWRPNHKGLRQFARTFDEAFGRGAEGRHGWLPRGQQVLRNEKSV